MASLFDESRLVTRFMPSLLHLSSVQVGVKLLEDFDSGILMYSYRSIKEKKFINLNEIFVDTFIEYLKSRTICRRKLLKCKKELLKCKRKLLKCLEELLKCKKELLKCKRTFIKRKRELKNRKRKMKNRKRELQNRKSELKNRKRELKNIMNINEYYKAHPLIRRYRAQQRLRLIPPCLRPTVMEAVIELESGIRRWKSYHSSILEVEQGQCIFSWKSNGMVDGTKAALQLVLNTNIDVRQRFRLACTYCFEDIINTLWAEMDASGKTDGNFEQNGNSMVSFWVRRLRQRSLVPWTQDFSEYIGRYYQLRIPVVYSSVFPLLQPRQRRKLLLYLKFANLYDFWLCFHAFTEEEVQVLLLFPYTLLEVYLQWPLRSLFIEAIEKIWDYIDEITYCFLLSKLFFIKERGEFDISELFEDFWEMTPDRLKESVKKYSYFRYKIDSWLDEISRKRKAYIDELRNYNKQ